jgi:hypothetical protein
VINIDDVVDVIVLEDDFFLLDPGLGPAGVQRVE